MEVRFRQFEYKTDYHSQRALFEECFPETTVMPAGNANHYSWKHGLNKNSHEFSALIGSNLIGYYAAINFTYTYNNVTNVTSGLVCDVMTGHKARGQGVFAGLGIYSTEQLSARGCDFTTGFPIRDEVIPGHKKAGWEVSFPLPLYAKLNGADSILNKFKVGFLAPIIKFLIKFLSVPFDFVTPSRSLVVSAIGLNDLVDDSDYPVLVDSMSDRHRIYLSKTKEFMKWRLGAPESEYRIVKSSVDGILSGYIVAKEIDKFGVRCLAILDLVNIAGGTKATKMLVKELIRTSRPSDLVLFMCNKNLYKNYKLYLCGFFRSPFKFTFIFKNLSCRVKTTELDHERNWHLTWLDSDDL